VVTATKANYKSGAIERRINVSLQNATASPESQRSIFARLSRASAISAASLGVIQRISRCTLRPTRYCSPIPDLRSATCAARSKVPPRSRSRIRTMQRETGRQLIVR
jgi:hypothetical protein